MEFQQVTRPLTELKAHPQQATYFNELSPEAFNQLVADIEANGLHHPLEVTRDGTIICGHQRWRALKQLKRREVLCKVYDCDAQDPWVIDRLIGDNVRRRQLTRLELAKLYLAMKKSPQRVSGTLRDYLAAQLGGPTGRSLANYVKILNSPPEVQAAWDARQLGTNEVQRVIAASKAQQKKIVALIQGGTPAKRAVNEVLRKIAKTTPSRSQASAGRSVTLALGSQVQRLIALAAQCRDQRGRQPAHWEPQEIADLTPGLQSVQGLCKTLLAEMSQATPVAAST